MLKEDELIGLFSLYRQEVRPFTDKQIALVQNFASQAVIAIENARLLNDLRQRTSDLTESLEQQTATSEVLQVINSTPGDPQPVFEAMLEKAVRICEAKFGNIHRWDGNALHLMATHNTPSAFAEHRGRSPWHPKPRNAVGRTIATKTVVHVADLAAEEAYTERRDPSYVAAVDLWAYGCFWLSHAEGERTDRCVHSIPTRSSSLHRQTDRLGHELCRPSRHCHRERAASDRAASTHQ